MIFSFFGQLFTEKNKKTSSLGSLPVTSKADESKIVETLGIRKLESMPVQAAKAFQLSCDPKSTLDDFIKIIESDEVLTARILKIANSVYFRRGEQAKDIGSAVANIGLDEIRCLLSAAMLKSLLRGNSKFRNAIWGNSIASAIAAKHLSFFTKLQEGEAFLSGLLHDVGKLILLQRVPLKYEKIIQAYFQTGKDIIELEEEALDLNHVEVGKWLSERWNFPETVRRAITFHHNKFSDQENEQGKNTSASALIKCADMLAHACRLGHTSQTSFLGSKFQERTDEITRQLKISTSELKNVETAVVRQYESEFSLYNIEEA